jgi:hypothetical protein
VGVTKIGSPEANIPQDIQLVGAHIASEHCVFQNMEGVVSLTPQPGALCYVNGRKVGKRRSSRQIKFILSNKKVDLTGMWNSVRETTMNEGT